MFPYMVIGISIWSSRTAYPSLMRSLQQANLIAYRLVADITQCFWRCETARRLKIAAGCSVHLYSVIDASCTVAVKKPLAKNLLTTFDCWPFGPAVSQTQRSSFLCTRRRPTPWCWSFNVALSSGKRFTRWRHFKCKMSKLAYYSHVHYTLALICCVQKIV